MQMELRGEDEADSDGQRKYDEVYDETYGGEGKRSARVAAWLHIISVREKLAVIGREPNDFPLDGFALFRPAQTRGPRNYIL